MGDIRGVLQQSLLALLDCKPNDPIDFLANYFLKECETNRVAQVAHSLEGLSTRNAALDENLHLAYEALRQYKGNAGGEEVRGLTGDIYSELLVTMLLHGSSRGTIPEAQADRLLHTLTALPFEPIPFSLFKISVRTCLLLREFCLEIEALFSGLDIEGKGAVSKSVCDAVLQELSMALKLTNPDSSSALEVASLRLEISHLTSVLSQENTFTGLSETRSLTALSKSFTVKKDQFVADALDIFLSQVPPLK